jgi:hypothetical protein
MPNHSACTCQVIARGGRMSVALKPRFSPCYHAPTPAHYPSPNCEPPNRHLQEPQFCGSAPSV